MLYSPDGLLFKLSFFQAVSNVCFGPNPICIGQFYSTFFSLHANDAGNGCLTYLIKIVG